MNARVWIRIGSRGSALALAQTHEAREAIAAAAGDKVDRIEIETIKTTGDRILDRSLADAGGKGLFTKELDLALLEGRVDCAVHSAKDLPTFLPEGLVIAGYRPREDVRDAFISMLAASPVELPPNASFGSASPRRIAQILRLRPDLRPALLRGNVETRLRKVERREVDATLLAVAGMKRLGLLSRATSLLSVDDFLPAAGQGAVAITIRADDDVTRAALAPALDAATGKAVTAERAFLAELDASCRTPIACYARIKAGQITLRGAAYEPHGREAWEIEAIGEIEEAQAVGSRAGISLRTKLPRDFFSNGAQL